MTTIVEAVADCGCLQRGRRHLSARIDPHATALPQSPCPAVRARRVGWPWRGPSPAPGLDSATSANARHIGSAAPHGAPAWARPGFLRSVLGPVAGRAFWVTRPGVNISWMLPVRLFRARPWIAAWLCTVWTLVSSCTGETWVFGNIPPGTFEFATVLPYDGDGPGGWQVAQVVVLVGRLSAMYPRTAICEVEVGLPIVNRQQGFISVEMAQEASATAADEAARKVLGEPRKPTGSACESFRRAMKESLRRLVRGATVGRFRDWPGKSVPRRTFPAHRGNQ